jgi:drug/metabolite transporter (DMT)-like permease
MIVALTGVGLTLEPNEILREARLQVDPTGVFFVIASAAGYGSYIVISARYAVRAGVITNIAWICAGAATSFMLGAFLSGGWEMDFSPSASWILLGMVVLSTVMALTFLLAGITQVGATTASLISTLEPLFTVVLSILLLHESLSLVQFIGGTLILTAVIGLNLVPNNGSAPG